MGNPRSTDFRIDCSGIITRSRTGKSARNNHTKPPRGGFVIRKLEYRSNFPPVDILDDIALLEAQGTTDFDE